MKMKKYAGMFLVLLLMLCCLPAKTVFADMGDPDLSSDKFGYYISGDPYEADGDEGGDYDIQGSSFYAEISGVISEFNVWYYYDQNSESDCELIDRLYKPAEGSDWCLYQAYTGKAIKPSITLYWFKDNDTAYTLTEGKDYTISYANNVNPGKATMTITGKGEVSGSKTITYYIRGKAPLIKSITNTSTGVTVTWNKCSYAKRYLVYLLSEEDGCYTWDYIGKTTGNSSFIKNKYFDHGYTNYIVVKADYTGGNGSDEFDSIYYQDLSKPVIKTVTTPSKGKLKVTWKKAVSGCKGYQVEISTTSNFAKHKIYTVKGYSSLSKTITGLKSWKKYYVRVRAYSYRDRGIYKLKYYSTWSGKKAIYVK